MRCQWLKVATQLGLCSLPVGKGSLYRNGCGDVVWGWVRMAGLCIVLDPSERPLLGCIVLFQPGGMFEQVGLARLVPVFLPTLDESGPFA
jgi:hypothetical protein